MRFDLYELRLTLGAWLCLASWIGTGTAADSPRPNVVLMMGDDHGWGDTGYNGHPFVRTPHLDRMAAEGLRFDRWYAAAPVCSPTRGSCLTGRHPYRYGVTGANVGHLKREEITLAERLKEAGYTTGHFGKWHLGTLTTTVKDANRGRPGNTAIYSPPWEHGFDVCFSTESKVPTFDPMLNPAAASRETKGRQTPGVPFGTAYWTGPEQSVLAEDLRGDDSTLIVDRALRFIDAAAAAQQQQPFLAVVWFHAPHAPVVADAEHRGLYPDHPHGLYGQHYHGCITAMDEQIGRLRNRLNELGVAGNTMVWYCADNGPEGNAMNGAGSAGPFRGRKRSLYEGGVRVPGLVVWPEHIPQGRSTNVPCVTSDYLPTILDYLQLPLPPHPLDGISLRGVIEGTATERGAPIAFQANQQRALSGDRFKLYSADAGQTWELYDLPADRGEERDVSAEHPEVVQQMARSLTDWIEACRRSHAGGDYRPAESR